MSEKTDSLIETIAYANNILMLIKAVEQLKSAIASTERERDQLKLELERARGSHGSIRLDSDLANIIKEQTE